MKPIDKAKTSARRSVADRMRMFIATLMGQFTTAPEELLQRAESELLIDQQRWIECRSAIAREQS